MDRDKVNQQFKLKRCFDTREMDMKMDMLEKWSDLVGILASPKTEYEKKEAMQSLDEVLYFMRFGRERRRKEEGSNTERTCRQDGADTVSA